jgi:hypothetical protein
MHEHVALRRIKQETLSAMCVYYCTRGLFPPPPPAVYNREKCLWINYFYYNLVHYRMYVQYYVQRA